MDKWTALPGLTTYPQAYLLLATTTRIQTAGVVQFCSAHVVRNLSALDSACPCGAASSGATDRPPEYGRSLLCRAQEAPPRPGVLRTLKATRGLGSVTVENLAAGMDTNGIGGHEREGLGAMTAIGRGLAAGRLTTDRESEAVHPKAQPPRPPTPRQRARWKAVQRAKRRGLSLRAIARELGISRITVRKYVEASSPPVYPDRELAAHS